MQPDAGERVIFEGHPSWRSILGFYAKGVLVTALAAGLAAAASRVIEDEIKASWIALAAIVVFGLALAIGLLKRIATTYTITTRRLHIRRGIVARRVQETRLDRVQNVNTRQSVLERILRVGTVDFDTAASGDYDFSFAGVASPEDVQRAVDRAQQEPDEQAP